MFIEMFTKNQIVFAQDDYKLLDNICIGEYKTKDIETRMKYLLSSIKELECRYVNYILKNLSHKYEFREEMFTQRKSDPTGNGAIEHIATEEELEDAFDSFKTIYDNLFCYYEKVMFVEMMLLGRSKEAMLEYLNIGTEKFYHVKKSLLVKLAIGLNWESIRN